jgi:hypothetical protein
VFGKGDRCDIGKSCGSTCIARLKVCRVDFGDNISESIDRISGSIDASFIDDAKESLEDYLARVEPNAKTSTKSVPKVNQESIKKPGKIITGNTQWARDDASDFDSSFKVGRVINGTKDQFDWSGSLGKGTKLGEGGFGTVLLIKGNPSYAVKRGQVSTTEAEITQILGKAGLGPKLVYGEIAKGKPKAEGGVYIINGRIVMGLVPGESYGSFSKSSDKVGKTSIGDAYWFLRSQVHRLGIAHNDAHSDNVLIDKNGRSRFVDMGLSQQSVKAALSEALGAFTNKGVLPKGSTFDLRKTDPLTSGDHRSKTDPQMGVHKGSIKGDAPQNLLKMRDNLPRVYDALRGHGISDNEITYMIVSRVGQPLKSYEKGPWAKLSNKDAAKVIDILYDGVKDYSKD